MKILELKKINQHDIGFIDPDKFNEATVADPLYNKNTDDDLLRVFKRYKDKSTIYWPYGFG